MESQAFEIDISPQCIFFSTKLELLNAKPDFHVMSSDTAINRSF
jgi:hypothetical protein